MREGGDSGASEGERGVGGAVSCFFSPPADISAGQRLRLAGGQLCKTEYRRSDFGPLRAEPSSANQRNKSEFASQERTRCHGASRADRNQGAPGSSGKRSTTRTDGSAAMARLKCTRHSRASARGGCAQATCPPRGHSNAVLSGQRHSGARELLPDRLENKSIVNDTPQRPCTSRKSAWRSMASLKASAAQRAPKLLSREPASAITFMRPGK